MKSNLFSCKNFQEGVIKLLLFVIVMSAGYSTNAFSQATITAPSLTITGCSPFPTNPDTLGNIVITESAAANFSVVAGGTLILTAPANFEFTAAGTASATGSEISSVSIALTNASTLTLTFTVTGTSVINSITISGIEVRGITGASGPVTINRTGGTSLIAGDTNGTVHATLTSVVNSVTGGTVSTSQTICSGGDPAAFTESVASTGSGTLTYQWKKSTDGYSTTLATSSTYDVPSGLAATTTYRRITTSTLGGVPCTANSNDITVTVNSVTGGTIAGAQTICSGGDPVAFTESVASSGSGTLTYQWKQSTDGYSTTLATSSTYDVPSGLAATTTYRRITTSTLGGVSCTANSNDITVTVNNTIANNTVSTAQTICLGDTPTTLTGSTPTEGSGSYTYLWESSTTSSTVGFAPASGTNTGTGYTPGALTSTTWYRRTVTSGPCSSNVSTAIEITVNPVIAGNTISANQTICSGSVPSALTGSTPTGGNGSYTYLWESSTTSSTVGFAAATGTNSTASYSPATLTTTTWYRRTVISGPCSNISTVIQITVTPGISNNNVTSAQTICSGTAPGALTGSIPSGGTGSYSYLWELSTTSSSAGFATASGTNTGITYTPGTLTTTSWYRRTVTSGVCTNISTAIEITINPIPVATATNNSQTICSGSAFSTIVIGTSNSVANTTYSWVRNNGSLSAGSVTGLASSGAGNIVGAALTNTTTAPVTVTFTIIPTGPTPTFCEGVPITATITVNPIPTLSSSTASQSICSGTTFNYTPASATSGTSFIWTRAAVTGISNLAGNGTGSISEALTNTTADPTDVTYVYSLSANSCANSGTYSIIVTVNPTPILSSSLTPPAICSDNLFSYVPSSTTSGASFIWTRPVVAGISNSAGNGTDNISETLTNTTANPVNVIYIYSITANSCTNAATYSVNVAVNPLPDEPVFTPYSSTVCLGTQNMSFTLDTIQNGVSFSWSATNASLASIWGGTPNSEFSFDTSGSAVITLQVTFISTGCINNHSENITVSQNAAPAPVTISILADNWLVCQMNGTGISYQWGYDSIPTLESVPISGAVFQQYHATDYPNSNKEYWVIVNDGGCFTKSYVNPQFLGIDRLPSEKSIHLFPNPAKENLSIACYENIISYRISEISGRCTGKKQIVNPQYHLSIDIKELNNGIYVIELETISHTKFSRKLIIQN